MPPCNFTHRSISDYLEEVADIWLRFQERENPANPEPENEYRGLTFRKCGEIILTDPEPVWLSFRGPEDKFIC